MTVDERSLDEVAAFHGHVCPGLALGMQAARIALAANVAEPSSNYS